MAVPLSNNCMVTVTCGSWSPYFTPLSSKLRKIIFQVHARAADDAAVAVNSDRLQGQAMPQANGFCTLHQQRRQIDVFGMRPLGAPFDLTNFQQVRRQLIKSLDIFQHEAVKLRPLIGVDVPPAERLQV